MHIYLSVNVFSTKGLIGDTIFMSPPGDRTAILRVHPSHRRSSHLQTVPSVLRYFKTLSIGPGPRNRIEKYDVTCYPHRYPR